MDRHLSGCVRGSSRRSTAGLARIIGSCSVAGSLLAGTSTVVIAASALPALAASPAATTIATGTSHACEILNGEAYCWGNNASGQLGNNSTISSSTPVAVYTGGALAGVALTQISAGSGFTCALASAGATYCWGSNANGQLGNNSTVQSNVPVAVNTAGVLSGKTLTQIAAGQNSTCALATTGAAIAGAPTAAASWERGRARKVSSQSRWSRPGY